MEEELNNKIAVIVEPSCKTAVAAHVLAHTVNQLYNSLWLQALFGVYLIVYLLSRITGREIFFLGDVFAV